MKEMVNHPDHYKSGKFEVIEIIQAFKLGFCLGNVVKYVLRAGKKDDTIQELRKAQKYLEFEIAELERQRAEETPILSQGVCAPGMNIKNLKDEY